MKEFFRVFILSIGVCVLFLLFIIFDPSLVAIGIGVVCLAAVLIFVLFFAFGGDNTKYLKDKFGDNYQDLINTGKLSAYTAAPCRPNEQYTNHDIFQLCNITPINAKFRVGEKTYYINTRETFGYQTKIDESLFPWYHTLMREALVIRDGVLQEIEYDTAKKKRPEDMTI